MTVRWPDGTPVAEVDPREQAHRLQAETIGWCVWWGPYTRRFFAMPLVGPLLFVEARTTGELVKQMAGWRW